MKRTIIAIDNGVTGSVAVIGPNGVIMEPTPTKDSLMGVQQKKIKRISFARLDDLLMPYDCTSGTKDVHAYIERPFTGGPYMINTALISARAFEATLIVLEQGGIPYTVVDSKEWQAAMLPGIKGTPNLKLASRVKGVEMFPKLASAIVDQGDADSLLMAHYYSNRN